MEVSGQVHVLNASPLGNELPVTFGVETVWGLSAGMDTVEQRKISYPCQKLKPDSSDVQAIA
jgi:hypothetical protein